LVMAVFFVVVLFPRPDRHTQPVLFWRQRTGGIGSDRARGVVSTVEIEYHGAVSYWAGLQKAATGVSLGLAGGIAEDEKQAFGGIAAQVGQPPFLAVYFENRRARDRGRGNVAQHIGNLNCLFAVRGEPGRGHTIRQIQREELWSVVLPHRVAFEVLEPDTHSLAAHD